MDLDAFFSEEFSSVLPKVSGCSLSGSIRDARGRCLGMALVRSLVNPPCDCCDFRDCGGYEILGAVKVKVGTMDPWGFDFRGSGEVT